MYLKNVSCSLFAANNELRLIDGSASDKETNIDLSGGKQRQLQEEEQQQQQQQQHQTLTRVATSTITPGKTHFADESSENVTALIGHAAVLLCSVRNLGNRTVSLSSLF